MPARTSIGRADLPFFLHGDFNNEAEIEAIRAFLGAPEQAVVKGDAASKTEVSNRNGKGDLHRTRVLAFATRGLLSGDFGIGEPALALTPPERPIERGGVLDDGLLRASDVATLDIGANLVILSACNTADGEKPEAEGLSGLARAFFYAGATDLLVSHSRRRGETPDNQNYWIQDSESGIESR